MLLFPGGGSQHDRRLSEGSTGADGQTQRTHLVSYSSYIPLPGREIVYMYIFTRIIVWHVF